MIVEQRIALALRQVGVLAAQCLEHLTACCKFFSNLRKRYVCKRTWHRRCSSPDDQTPHFSPSPLLLPLPASPHSRSFLPAPPAQTRCAPCPTSLRSPFSVVITCAAALSFCFLWHAHNVDMANIRPSPGPARSTTLTHHLRLRIFRNKVE